MSQARIAVVLFSVVSIACGRRPTADSPSVSAGPVADTSTSSNSPDPSPAKGAATGTVDPCALITKAEAEAALGMSVTGPEIERDGSGVTCTYTHSGTTLVIHVGLQPSSPSAIEQTSKLYGVSAKILSGIGDAAFEGPGRMISGVKNSKLFLISTGAGPGIISEERFLALARTVAARL